jgi:hypothetical protein
LLRRGVNASRVVRARVEKEDGALLRLLPELDTGGGGGNGDVLEHALEVEAAVGGVEVGVVLHVEASATENGDVVSPRRVGEENGLALHAVDQREEHARKAASASAGDGLRRGELLRQVDKPRNVRGLP